MHSFVSKSLGEEKIIQAVVEGILFGNHQIIKFKEKENKKKTENYYLITKSKKAQTVLTDSLDKLEAVN